MLTYVNGFWVGVFLGAAIIIGSLITLVGHIDRVDGTALKKAHSKGDRIAGPPSQLYVAWCVAHGRFADTHLMRRKPPASDYECPVMILQYDVKVLDVPKKWMHTICLPCWNSATSVDRRPARPDLPVQCVCCFCGKETDDGIPVTSDPSNLKCTHVSS